MTENNARETSADRWSSWRRGATVSVTPAGTRLYRVLGCDAECIIGLSTTQLSLMGAAPKATASAGDVLAYLDRTGYLRAWEYRVSGSDRQGWYAEPTRQIRLFAHRTIHIAPFDPATDVERLANAA